MVMEDMVWVPQNLYKACRYWVNTLWTLQSLLKACKSAITPFWLPQSLSKGCRSLARHFWLRRSVLKAFTGWTDQFLLPQSYLKASQFWLPHCLLRSSKPILTAVIHVMTTAKTVECLQRVCSPSLYFTYTGLVESLYRIVIPVLTPAMPVESL